MDEQNLNQQSSQLEETAPRKLPRNRAFFGSYDHALDAKGRLIVPTAYRKPLGSTFTIGLTRDLKSIAFYPESVFDEILDGLYELDLNDRLVQDYLNRFTKLCYPGSEADSQGRLLIPAKLRQEMLGDAKDVEISGALDHVRVISLEKSREESERINNNLDELIDYISRLRREKSPGKEQ